MRHRCSCLLDSQSSRVLNKEKLAAALFMDMKGAFNHISQTRLIAKMIELEIDDDLVRWTQLFLKDQTIQLVIDGYDNRKCRIITRILQGSPVFPILFLIYFNGVFVKVTESNPAVISLSFIDNLGFIFASYSVKEMAKTLN